MEEMTFNKYINSLPDLKRVTIERIAKETMSTEASVYRWIKGDVTPPPIKQSVIADIVGISAEILFPKKQ